MNLENQEAIKVVETIDGIPYNVFLKGKQRFLVPIRFPEGLRLDPTNCIIGERSDQFGKVLVPRWNTNDYESFRLTFSLYDSIPAAIRACVDHIPDNYRRERKNLAQFLHLTKQAVWIYLYQDPNSQQYFRYVEKRESDLRDAFHALGDPKRPEKQKAQVQIVQALMKGETDSLNRRNPYAIAAQVSSGIYNIQNKRIPTIPMVLAHVAADAEALQFTRAVNLGAFSAIFGGLKEFKDSPLFKKNVIPTGLQFNSAVKELSQLSCETMMIVGRPYCLMVSDIQDRIATITSALKVRDRDTANLRCRELLSYIVLPRKYFVLLKAMLEKAVILDRDSSSVETEENITAIMFQLKRDDIQIHPGIQPLLDGITSVTQRAHRLAIEKTPETSFNLKIAIARCMW